MMTTILFHSSDQVIPASLVLSVNLKVRCCLKAFLVSIEGKHLFPIFREQDLSFSI